MDVLRQVWIQQYPLDDDRDEVIWRDADNHGLPPGRTLIVSPYDFDARHGEKRSRAWTGYKVHITETCDNIPDQEGRTDPAQPPNLITNVVTTHAAVDDSTMTMPIHHASATRNPVRQAGRDAIVVTFPAATASRAPCGRSAPAPNSAAGS